MKSHTENFNVVSRCPMVTLIKRCIPRLNRSNWIWFLKISILLFHSFLNIPIIYSERIKNHQTTAWITCLLRWGLYFMVFSKYYLENLYYIYSKIITQIHVHINHSEHQNIRSMTLLQDSLSAFLILIIINLRVAKI